MLYGGENNINSVTLSLRCFLAFIIKYDHEPIWIQVTDVPNCFIMCSFDAYKCKQRVMPRLCVDSLQFGYTCRKVKVRKLNKFKVRVLYICIHSVITLNENHMEGRSGDITGIAYVRYLPVFDGFPCWTSFHSSIIWIFGWMDGLVLNIFFISKHHVQGGPKKPTFSG